MTKLILLEVKDMYRGVRYHLTVLAFISPLLLGMLFFSVYPMISALLMSFKNTKSGQHSAPWIGLKNYEYLLSDPMFWKSIYNTLYMGVLSACLGIVCSFILASLINGQKRKSAKNFFKAIYFLPNIVSIVATSTLFSFIFYPSAEGLLNHALGWFHIEPVGWFTNPQTSQISIVLMSVWYGLGYNTIIFLAGLQSVPKDLYEAAEVDGAGIWRKWTGISIPYMRPIFLFMIVIGMIDGMKRFTDVWLIGGTAGNPNGTLMTVVLYIYRQGFLSSEMGLATAASYLLFVLILLLSAVMILANRRKSDFY
ncbi:carbohydrate ABC transporter permease [Paenibacillus sp. 481]|uniref:carbohydrate ABC transporter permease n=1 Tax=Paenibacillus sp. 481 TaxID=2835869 RepID=UPI001E4350A4|nr:sugar ABC transporter permease [Paenibacillus sp. 481]UHA73521.1 sugar ABC transporter permease [Paenibacillus sp. 481]